MFLPRRRITSLTLASIIVFGIWYLYDISYSHSSRTLSDAPQTVVTPLQSPIKVVESSKSDVQSDATVTSHRTSSAELASQSSVLPSNSPDPSLSLQSGQQVFGSRTFVPKHPVKVLKTLPSGPPLDLPKIQADFEFEKYEETIERLKRLRDVKSSFLRSWKGYKKHAWLKDELSPLDGGSAQSFGGWAATLVDTLDTLWIMDLKEEFEEAVAAINEIDFNTTSEDLLNIFETTIRYLGGFLGAYDLTDGAYPVLLEKAKEVANLVYCAFDTPNRMPATRWRWKEALEGGDQTASEGTLIAEIGSLTLEFTRLSQLTGEMKYYDAVQRIMDEFEIKQSSTLLPGLWPVVMNAKKMTFVDNGFSLSSMADSLYEYLPKQHMLLGGRGEQMRKMYQYAVTTAMNHMFFQPMVPSSKDILVSGGITVDAENKKDILNPTVQHLGCYTGGMVGIGAKVFDQPKHMYMARRLVDGCIWAYDSMPSGIMPEVFDLVPCAMNSDCVWDENIWREAVLKAAKNRHEEGEDPVFEDDEQLFNWTVSTRHLRPGYVNIQDSRYLLRPETIESVFIHYRLTGEKDLMDVAWRMFEAIDKHTKTKFGNAMITDVTAEKPEKANKMESFWMAETSKYFYLIFSEPTVVSLDDYVLNTEAHPFKRPKASTTESTSNFPGTSQTKPSDTNTNVPSP